MALCLFKLKDNSAFAVFKQQHRNVTEAKYIVWTKCVVRLIPKSGGTDSNHCALNTFPLTLYFPYPRVKEYLHYVTYQQMHINNILLLCNVWYIT